MGGGWSWGEERCRNKQTRVPVAVSLSCLTGVWGARGGWTDETPKCVCTRVCFQAHTHTPLYCVLRVLRCVLTYQSSFWTRVPDCFTVRKSVEAAEQAGVSALCLRPRVATQDGGGGTHGAGALGTAGRERARSTAGRWKGLRGVT